MVAANGLSAACESGSYSAAIWPRRAFRTNRLGPSQRHVTISTVGLVPAMRALTAEGVTVTLALSLHAPDDELVQHHVADDGDALSLEGVDELVEAHGVSGPHGLVLVNHGSASGAQLLSLAHRIRDSVEQRFGVSLEPEPTILR